MRALAIAGQLKDAQITFVGSDLASYCRRIPAHIACIHLPLDFPAKDEGTPLNAALSFLHYAPLNVRGLKQRNNLLATFFAQEEKLLLIVDVSVEITLLARLCGVPTVVIRQHGLRNDLPHRLAYESAELIIAPYPAYMGGNGQEDSFQDKTFFSGGFSRYTGKTQLAAAGNLRHLAIFIGKGGTCLDMEFIGFLREQLPSSFHLHILGKVPNKDDARAYQHCTFYGNLEDPLPVLEKCGLVISNAGHNTIMEIADLRKRLICVPADRPFDEQYVKAEYLNASSLAMVIQSRQLFNVDWPAFLKQAWQTLRPDAWEGTTDVHATANIAARLEMLYSKLFGPVENVKQMELINT